MVDTFSCDSCGLSNVPTDEKRTLSVKSTEATGQVNARGKAGKQTVTIAMEICPDCMSNGIVKNDRLVSKAGQPERHFTWQPRKDLASIYVWGQNGQKTEDKK